MPTTASKIDGIPIEDIVQLKGLAIADVAAICDVEVSSAPPIPCMVVAGAGEATVDGNYTERGTNDGKPYYNLFGQSDDPFNQAISWNTEKTYWQMFMPDTKQYVSDGGDVATPDLATWIAGGEGAGTGPAPTVTAGFLP